MTRKLAWIASGVGAVVLAGAGIGLGVAQATSGGDDNQTPISGPALEQAKAAALAETGGGTVSETEAGDEDGGYYQVEVTKADGSKVDVNLDESFKVVKTKSDSGDSTAGSQGAGEIAGG